jgi:hypothetical protein
MRIATTRMSMAAVMVNFGISENGNERNCTTY